MGRPKTPSMQDVARVAGVTKSAVSLALRNDPRIPEKTTLRIRGIADRLGYRRNAVVAHLMSQLRVGDGPKGRPTIALLNLNEDPDAFVSHPTIPAYVKGIRSRADALGYSLDEFAEPVSVTEGSRLLRILQARGVRGCILTGLMRSNALPPQLLPVVESLPCVITGVRTPDVPVPFACADHHATAQLALAKALEAGCRRPALVLEQGIDELVQGRFTAGFLIGQRGLPPRHRVPPFYHRGSARSLPEDFADWWRRHRPDAVLTLYHVVSDWLATLGVDVPGETSLIQLETRVDSRGWAGVDQHNDRTGASAVDLLIQMIHAGETGADAVPRAILTEPSWRDGATLPAVKRTNVAPGSSRERLATSRS